MDIMMTNNFDCLHDGYLYGLLLDEKNSLLLFCKDIQGKHWKVIVNKTIKLRVENFWEGNIIFSVRSYSGKECPVDLIKKVYKFNDEAAERLISQTYNQIIDKKLFLTLLNSSYGCELIALSQVAPELVSGRQMGAS